MPEWLMGADCNSAGYTYAGSNPARLICLLVILNNVFILSIVIYTILCITIYFGGIAKR